MNELEGQVGTSASDNITDVVDPALAQTSDNGDGIGLPTEMDRENTSGHDIDAANVARAEARLAAARRLAEQERSALVRKKREEEVQ